MDKSNFPDVPKRETGHNSFGHPIPSGQGVVRQAGNGHTAADPDNPAQNGINKQPRKADTDSQYSKTSLNRPTIEPTLNGPLREVVSLGS